jgi:type 2 lantibiotic biosynthesis protein LanM
MTTPTAADAFSRIVHHLLAGYHAEGNAQLQALAPMVWPEEIALLQAEAYAALHNNAQLKLNRLLLLELHAALRSGQLGARDSAQSLEPFEAWATSPAFLPHLAQRYPALQARLDTLLRAQTGAIVELATRVGEDRAALSALLGAPAGQLISISLGKGDTHGGGRTVARLSFEGGTVMYKPRSLRIDAVLDAFLEEVFPNDPQRVCVPSVIDRGTHGWAAYAAHRYCDDDAQLFTYYRGLGHWLAVLRLIGGTDIHLENLIAVGPTPVVVDAESVFATPIESEPTGYGHAYDLAVTLMRNSVLRTGIVPFRTVGLGMEGVDLSAAGALPGEQPKVRVPVIVEEAGEPARLGMVESEFAVAQNHPSPNPDVSRYWDHISEGFMDASRRLRALDQNGRLTVLLARFEGSEVREVQRPTMAYAEIGRMLWHPASLHDEPRAIARALDLLVRNAAVAPAASADPQAVLQEIDALRYGDIPLFSAPLVPARIHSVADNWRAMRIDLEDVTIRSTLVATDLNQHALARAEARDGYSYAARAPHARNLEARRRRQAAAAVDNLIRLAVRGDDGTLTWITPEITQSGWTVQPVQPDVYFGLGGIAFSLAAYAREVDQGRADPVGGVEQALEGALRVYLSMCRADAPDAGGGLVGAGSRVWTLLALHDLLGRAELLDAARDAAAALEAGGFGNVAKFEMLDGVCGPIVPLIHLAEATGESRWLEVAALAARQLQATAIVDEGGARWPTPQFDEPIGGFGHGAMGIGWALARLAMTGAGSASERAAWEALAQGAFAFQAALFEPDTGRWRDIHLKDGQKNFPTWCHGSVGIGLAAADLYARTGDTQHLSTLRRAVADANGRWGFSHTLCHGDLSTRELLVMAARLDPDGCPYPVDTAAIEVISSIEEHNGMVGGLTRAAFTPGLMIGLAGAVYGFCRMHPDCRLPSPLLLERDARVQEATGQRTSSALAADHRQAEGLLA